MELDENDLLKHINYVSIIHIDDNSTKIYRKIKRIGNGSTSVVYKVMDKYDNSKMYALKVQVTTHCYHEYEFSINKSLKQLSNSDEYLVLAQGYGIIKDAGYYENETIDLFLMLFELMDGSLLKMIKTNAFTKQEYYNFINQAVEGLHLLHQNNCTHGDVSTINIMFKRNDNNKIIYKYIDFGNFAGHNDLFNYECYNCYIPWKLPYHESLKYIIKLPVKEAQTCDIFALGLTLYQILFKDENVMDDYSKHDFFTNYIPKYKENLINKHNNHNKYISELLIYMLELDIDKVKDIYFVYDYVKKYLQL